MSLVQDAMTPAPSPGSPGSPGSSGAPGSPVRSPQAAVPAARPEQGDFLNLAQRPFLNSRPVVRTATILWLLGSLLLLGNVMLFWSYLSESEEKRTELASLTTEIEAERARGAQLKERVANRNLEEYNLRVQYLNRKILERTFSWSLLFDNIARVMPSDVRITRLKPSGVIDQKADRRSSVSVEEEGITLQIQGEAKNDEAFLNFVENLFTPPFGDPDFSRETLDEEGNRIKFDLTVKYLPAAAEPQGQGIRAAPELSIEELPAEPAAPGAPGDAGAGPGARP
jgi:Tfp pilus assembly protein PilN